jgi:two-component system, OmpR family, heavy metal sensor histidine kinase CusS
MFSKRTEPQSIASQLVLLFTLAAALLLSCGLGVLYVIVVRHAFQEDNAFLADKILALRADLSKAEWPGNLNEELKTLRRGEHLAYWIRVVDTNDRTLVETPGMNDLLPSHIFPKAENSGSTIRASQDYTTRGKLFSLASVLEDAGGQPYTIQVAQDRSGDEDFTGQFGVLLAVVLVVGIGAAALIAVTVTKRGLRPLAEITRALKRTGPTHLNERLVPARWPRELQPLAVAFDQMLDRLEDSFTRLSQFSADLAHELRTPVANMRGEAEVALTRARTPEEYRSVIESSVAECERLSGMINNLLFLARAEAADKDLQRTVFDAKAAIEKIATFYESIAEEQQVAIVCAGHGEILADPILFGRAVSNLVDNALRFTPAGGTIRIAIETGAAQSRVSVSDTGCGIAAQDVARVFDRFYRVDSSRSSQGTGLGLALVKSIVDLHGGSAAIESEVDRGTTVILTFPRKSGVDSNA